MFWSLFKISRQVSPLLRLYRRPGFSSQRTHMGKRTTPSKPNEIELQSVDNANTRPKRRPRKESAASTTDSESENVVPSVAESKPGRKKAASTQPPGVVFHEGLRPPPYDGPIVKLVSWNVAGLRAVLKKNVEAIRSLVETTSCDVLCLQEHKLQCQHVEEVTERLGLSNWWNHWSCSSAKKGYSGVAILSRHPPLKVVEGIGTAGHDEEGRVLTAEYESFFLVNVYVPNAGEGLRRLEYRTMQWDIDFSNYLKGLESSKPVVVTGDLNCAHMAIDIHNPKGNLRSAGFTQEERDSFTANFIEQGFVDCFRHLYPGVIGYTYWTYKFNCRKNNKGWRLDYFLASSSLVPQLHDCYPMAGVMGSDHCPLIMLIKKPGATTETNEQQGANAK